MAYQNVYYEKQEGIIHAWDDKKGYFTKKYRNYAYQRMRHSIWKLN